MGDILARLLRACATGYGCRSVISKKGLGNLTRQGLWHEAADAIIRLDTVHPRSRDCFLEAWMQGSFAHHLDADLAVAFLYKVLPPYLGFDAILFRGQVRGQVGMSWTCSPNVALKFALFGDRDASWIDLEGKEGRADAIILAAIVPAANIICAPCLHGKAEGEYVIDPRGLEFSTEPASEAAVWIREHTASVLGRVNNPASFASL
jgi:hypothetical protein